MKILPIVVAGICFAFLIPCYAAPFIVGAQAKEDETTLDLPGGCQLYVYGIATGGARPSSAFESGQTIQIQNAAGITSVQLAATNSNNNSYPTDTSYHVIVGFGASGFGYVQGFYGANPSSGAHSASVQFTLNAPAMVVLLGVASSQQSLAFSGLPNLVTDVPYTTTEASSIAHTYLGTGMYTAQMTSSDTSPGQTPENMADLIGVLIFSDRPSVAKSDNPQIPLPQPSALSSIQPRRESGSAIPAPPPPNKPEAPSRKGSTSIVRYVIIGIGVLVFAGLAVAVTRLAMPRSKDP